MSDIPLAVAVTETELTYEGQGDGAGMTLVVKKDDEYLDVHQRIPMAMATHDWRELRDRLVPQLSESANR